MMADIGMRRLLPSTLLTLVVLAIGVRYVFERTGIVHFAGWMLVIGSLTALVGYFLALRRR